MTLCVQMIFFMILLIAGVWRDRMWPDGWTAVTADGKRSAQFEHTLLVNLLPYSNFSFLSYYCSNFF